MRSSELRKHSRAGTLGPIKRRKVKLEGRNWRRKARSRQRSPSLVVGGQTWMFDLVANEPGDVPTRETVMFLASRIPAGAEILEIGCGEGLVACELFRRGYRDRIRFRPGAHRKSPKSRGSRHRRIVAGVRRQRFFRCDRLHSFIAPHQPVARSGRSRTRGTKPDRIVTY
jgi:hypothetical protein